MPRLPLESTARSVLVTTYLDAYFARKIAAAGDVHPRYETLWREIARVAGHGKRLRPLMVTMAYDAFGGEDPSRVIPAAAACELLHVAMLIHDDVIDRDLMRHGEPTIQAAYETRYAAEIGDRSVLTHNAISAAVLAGDLLLSDARGLITKSEAPAEALRQAGVAFDQAVFEVAGGELLDVESSAAPRGSVSALTVVTHKTASYSFVGPLLIGAILAGAPRPALAALRSFALNLGIAYQLTDDILGIFGDSYETGKPNDGDIREGKATYLVERFYALASAADAARFDTFYGNQSAAAADCDAIRRLLKASGALAETERSVRSHADAARAALGTLGFSDSANAAFTNLITLCTDRSS